MGFISSSHANAQNVSAGTSIGITIPNACAAGDRIFAVVSHGGSAAAVSGSSSNVTWRAVRSISHATNNQYFYLLEGEVTTGFSASTESVTFSWTGSYDYRNVDVVSYTPESGYTFPSSQQAVVDVAPATYGGTYVGDPNPTGTDGMTVTVVTTGSNKFLHLGWMLVEDDSTSAAASLSAGTGYTERFESAMFGFSDGSFPDAVYDDATLSNSGSKAVKATYTIQSHYGISLWGGAIEQVAAGSVGSSAGVGAASAVGASNRAASGSSAGVATASATGQSTRAAAGTSAGVGAANGTGQSIAEAVGSSAGVGAANAVGSAETGSVGTSAGAATATAVGASTAEAAGSTAGVGAASGVGASTVEAVGSSAGVGAASGVGTTIVESVGSSAGVATATAVGDTAGTINSGAGSSTGVATVSGVGASTAAGAGSSPGVGAAAGVGASTAAVVGTAAGVATAPGIAEAVGVEEGVGTAAGTSNVIAIGTWSGYRKEVPATAPSFVEEDEVSGVWTPESGKTGTWS